MAESLFGESTWAERVQAGDWDRDFGPYVVNPDQHRLMLAEEIRRTRVDDPYVPSPGWIEIGGDAEYEAQVWCPPGGRTFFEEGRLKTKRVYIPEGDTRPPPASVDGLFRLIVSGQAFLYRGSAFLLPPPRFPYNTVRYEEAEPEPLTVLVGYRGHVRDYPWILTPSVLRNSPAFDDYLSYKAREGYAGDLLREAYFRKRGDALQDLQVRGILQHHKTIGDTDVLDLTWDPEVAKLFALHDIVDVSGEPWKFQAKEWKGPDDFAYIYQVVVRVLGSTSEPLPVMFRGRPVTLLPFNVCPLSMVTEIARPERGFGLSGMGPEDRDNFGMILNVTEWRYNPDSFPHGWDPIGGPRSELVAEEAIEREVLPPEPTWLAKLLADVRRRVRLRDLALAMPSGTRPTPPETWQESYSRARPLRSRT